MKYLPNGQYNRFATVKLYGNDTKNESVINISEEGEWDISDNYLLVSPVTFKDVSSAQSKDFTEEHLSSLLKSLNGCSAKPTNRYR